MTVRSSSGSSAVAPASSQDDDAVLVAGVGGLRRIGVAFIDTADGHEAVRHAADLAAREGLPRTLYSVVGVHANWFVPEAVRPEEETIPVEVRKDYQEALDRALAEAPEGGYGPLRRVLLGTVSAALLRQASVPVLVVPRRGG